MGFTKDQLLDRLKELRIEFKCYDHPVVLTVEEQAKYVGDKGGVLSKNLLLKDKKHRFYLVSALAGTKVDLKILSQRLGLGKGGVRMAPEENLQEILQVPLGCVTPFALINDSASAVSLMMDQGFKGKDNCYFHPLTNDVTISLSLESLEKFLSSVGRQVPYVDFEVNPAVGKDNPPDLASLVPSEVPAISAQLEKVSLSSVVPSQSNVPGVKIPKKLAAANSQSSLSNLKGNEGPSTVDPTIEVMDIEKLALRIRDKMSKAFGAEKSSVFDNVWSQTNSDVKSLLMILKNTAYAEGYHDCLGTVQLSLQHLSHKNS